jgi:3-isopropylmalate/(R)-2-methylmalate dehydratase small subunit
VLQWCDGEFAERRRPGDFIIAGPNFGYGHPHYPTMIGMRKLGISGVIGEHFAPGYWIGEISKGFPQISCPGILASTDRWDELEVDWGHLLVRNHTKGLSAPFERLSSSEVATLEAGGFLSYLQRSQKPH